jgi:hypothetical protein
MPVQIAVKVNHPRTETRLKRVFTPGSPVREGSPVEIARIDAPNLRVVGHLAARRLEQDLDDPVRTRSPGVRTGLRLRDDAPAPPLSA